MHRIHHDDETTRERFVVLDLDEIARRGAREMLAQALEAEVEAYLQATKEERDGHGRAISSYETATRKAGRLYAERELSKLRPPGSSINGSMS